MLDVFQQKCLTRILKISWKDHINEEVRDRAGIEPLSSGVEVEHERPRAEAGTRKKL